MATSLKKFLLLFLLSLLGPQLLSASERRLVGTELRYSSGGHAWTGLDLGAPYVVTRVGFMSSGNKSDVFLGVFEGANQRDFQDAVPLWLVQKDDGNTYQWQITPINVSRGFRYLRFVAPQSANGKLVSILFYGEKGEGDDSQFYQLTNLPTVSIHIAGEKEPKDKVNQIDCRVQLIYDDGHLIQDSAATIRLRGNTSMGWPKKPYRIKFQHKTRPFRQSDLAAPAKCKKWTLVNPYDDKTLLRNVLAFEASRRIGLAYTPWCQLVDVLVNGEFRGTYQFTDQVTVDKDRIPVPELLPEDNELPVLSGGYFLEMDALAGGEPCHFTSQRGIPVTVKSPDSDAITPVQRQYIEQHFNLMESTLYSDNYLDPEDGYRRYIDADSYMRHFLCSEFCANSDMYWSCYLYKNRDEDAFHIGPVWDVNLGFDNDGRSYPNRQAPDWTYRHVVSYAGTIRQWADRIQSDPLLQEELCTMWSDLRESGRMDPEGFVQYLDSLEDYVDASQRLNFLRWDNLLQYTMGNPQIGGSYAGEVEVVRSFIRDRFVWMDRRLSNPDPVSRLDTMHIADASDLFRFTMRVNQMGETGLNAILEADIDYRDYDQSIGTSSAYYNGTFDGGGHRILIDFHRTDNIAAPFGYLSGTVQNLVVEGDIHTSAKFAAGIASHSYGSTVQRCVSHVHIHSTISGDGTHGGLVAVTDGGGTIRQCVFAGSMEGNKTGYNGGIVGWASTVTKIEDCLQLGDIQCSSEGSHTISRNYGNVQSSGCFYLQPYGETSTSERRTTERALSNGSLCYRLNGNSTDVSTTVWRQNLDTGVTDSYPVPLQDHGIVYFLDGVYTNCCPDIVQVPLQAKPQSDIYFDLQGRPVARPYSGLYIRNGKKVLMKKQ